MEITARRTRRPACARGVSRHRVRLIRHRAWPRWRGFAYGSGTAAGAPNDSACPDVWNGDRYAASFGITSRIFLDQITPAGFPATPNKSATTLTYPLGIWFADANTLYVADLKKMAFVFYPRKSNVRRTFGSAAHRPAPPQSASTSNRLLFSQYS